MKKMIALLMALILVGGAFTGCSDEKEQSSENSKVNSAVTDTPKFDEDSDDEDDKPVDDDSVDAEKVDKYSTGYGLTLCDEESIVPIQGSIVDIAMGYDVLCLTKDEKVVSFEEDMILADAPGGVRFVDDTVGYGAIVECADGTCMYFDDFYEAVMLRREGFKMHDGSNFEYMGDMKYIVNNGEKLVGYYYDDDMNLITSEAPVYIDPESRGDDEKPAVIAKSWVSLDYSSFYIVDINNNVWNPWEPAGVLGIYYDRDENYFDITTFNDPIITDCQMMCYEPNIGEVVIAKTTDESNLYLYEVSEDKETYGDYFEIDTIPLPDGLKTTDIKEFVRNSDDGLFITNSNEIYSITESSDGYKFSHQEQLSQLNKDGKIVEIVGDGWDTLFLMDDGCVYEK